MAAYSQLTNFTPLFPPKLFILCILHYVFFISCHSWKKRRTSCKYSSSFCPCFQCVGAAHFLRPLLPCDTSAGRFGIPLLSQTEEFRTCHIKVEMGSGQVCTRMFAEGNEYIVDRDQPRKSNTLLLQLLSNLHRSSNNNDTALQQKTTSHLNHVKDSLTCAQHPH